MKRPGYEGMRRNATDRLQSVGLAPHGTTAGQRCTARPDSLRTRNRAASGISPRDIIEFPAVAPGAIGRLDAFEGGAVPC
jgi:hypothetical protein